MSKRQQPADSDIQKACSWLESLTEQELDTVIKYLEVRKAQETRQHA